MQVVMSRILLLALISLQLATTAVKCGFDRSSLAAATNFNSTRKGSEYENSINR